MAQNKNTYKIMIDGKDYTQYIPFPIKWSKQLDEQLDQTRLSAKCLSDKIIHPLTPLTVTMTDKNGKELTLNTVVTTDQSSEVPVGSGKYNHEIMCLEETKILEGIVVDALTFTNDLGRNYTNNAPNAEPGIEPKLPGDTTIVQPDNYKSPLQDGAEFTFCSWKDLVKVNWSDGNYRYPLDGSVKITFNNRPLWSAKPEKTGDTSWVTKTFSTTLKSGTYQAIYYGEFATPGSDFNEMTVTYTFAVVKNQAPLPRWNIATVIDRVLELAETHLDGVKARFYLNGKDLTGNEQHTGQYAEFKQIEAPEFAFTNSTLKEILDQIGGYIHGIPRLRGNVIYFDMLGGIKQAEIAKPQYKYISNTYSQDIESYCTSLDSTVDNLVCLTDRAQGAITEPYIMTHSGVSGGKSLRTETVYARVEMGNLFIETQYPIQELISLVNTFIPGKDYLGNIDITSYVFEKSVYAHQSSYGNTYPKSKAFALYYTQGEKNIYGLDFKRYSLVQTEEPYAIINILRMASGQTIGALGENYPALAFQVSYIPIFNARTQQTKQYIGDYKQPRALVYNQGANLIETRHFGENMKGAVARMGNVDRVVQYNLSTFSLIPEIGELYDDDYYISGVVCELYPNFIKCMLTLSQDFNRLSQYIGINSVRRFYEVSEKQAYRRDIKYADYVVVGDAVEQDDTLPQSIGFLATQLKAEQISDWNPSFAIAQGDSLPTKVSLPVVSTAQGTAMVFTFAYEDNYSAGTMAESHTEDDDTGYFTNAVAYGDYYGRMHTLKFALKSSSSVSEALELPLTQQELSVSSMEIGAVDKGIVVDKDGAEILSMNYVLEFVANRRNIVIGSALTQDSPLVKRTISSDKPALYILPMRISKFASKVDLSSATNVWEFDETRFSINGKSLKLADFTASVSGQSWVIAKPNGELLLGSNEPITERQTVSMPYLTLRHDIFNLGGNN